MPRHDLWQNAKLTLEWMPPMYLPTGQVIRLWQTTQGANFGSEARAIDGYWRVVGNRIRRAMQQVEKDEALLTGQRYARS